MAVQSGAGEQRDRLSSPAPRRSAWSWSIAPQRHIKLMYQTGIESREQLGRVVHVDVRLKHPRLLRYSTDGRAVGHVPAAPPGQLARSASVVLVM